jgi:membrane protein YqaA with SNARE-associated domain
MTNAITGVLLHAWSKNSKNYFQLFLSTCENCTVLPTTADIPFATIIGNASQYFMVKLLLTHK